MHIHVVGKLQKPFSRKERWCLIHILLPHIFRLFWTKDINFYSWGYFLAIPPPTLPNIVSICLYTHSLTSSFNLCKLIVNYYLPGNVVIIDIRRVVSGFLTLIFQLKFLWSFGLVSDVYAWKYGFHWYSRTIQTTWPNWNQIPRNLEKNIFYRYVSCYLQEKDIQITKIFTTCVKKCK